MSNIELSWQDTPSAGAGSTIEEMPSLVGSVSGAIYDGTDNDRIAYRIMYLRNNGRLTGNPVAYNAGFYVQAYGPEHGDNYNLHDILQWSQESDGSGKPYGAFTVFGYSDSSGTVSFIDKFIDNTISASSLRKFQHNWVQGSSVASSIGMDTAYRYDGSTYVQSPHFEGYDTATSVIATGETKGLLRVCFGVRIPNTIQATRVLLNHNVFYEQAS